MSKHPQIVTANHLMEGDVIYLTAADHWTRELSEAEVITDEAHCQLRLLLGMRQPAVAVGVYMMDVKLTDAGPEPIHFREDFRATGPSNYLHGKQEKKDASHV